MWPTLYEHPGGTALHTYGMFILLAFCAAFLLTHWRVQRVGYHPDRLIPLYVAAAVGGLLGGRILYSLAVEPGIWGLISSPGDLFAGSGFALYGGIIGGAVGVGFAARYQGLDLWKMSDVAAPAVLIGVGVGRIACFFAGCCHGSQVAVADMHPLLPDGLLGGQVYWTSGFPWIVNVFDHPDGVGRLLHVPLYPTQLWHAFGATGLAIFTTLIWDRRRFDGQIAAFTLMSEPLVRAFTESFRADQRGYFTTFPVNETVARWLPGLVSAGDAIDGARMGITTSQAIGAACLVLGVAIMAYRWNAGKIPEISVDDQEDLDLARA